MKAIAKALAAFVIGGIRLAFVLIGVGILAHAVVALVLLGWWLW